ncbi:MAG: hypothetical protein ACI9O2_000814 [Flammeovirgaceae bacterium]|jgi:hypothetical protein
MTVFELGIKLNEVMAKGYLFALYRDKAPALLFYFLMMIKSMKNFDKAIFLGPSMRMFIKSIELIEMGFKIFLPQYYSPLTSQ